MRESTVDASVWVAAADPNDAFHSTSQTFLAEAELQGVRTIVPAFARTEVACALARKRRDVVQARRLTTDVMALSVLVSIEIDANVLDEALRLGTQSFLRGADALYAATAHLIGTQLISWDNELIQRAGAITPTAWLDANP